MHKKRPAIYSQAFFKTQLAIHWIERADSATHCIKLPSEGFAIDVSLEGQRTWNATISTAGFDCDMTKS